MAWPALVCCVLVQVRPWSDVWQDLRPTAMLIAVVLALFTYLKLHASKLLCSAVLSIWWACLCYFSQKTAWGWVLFSGSVEARPALWSRVPLDLEGCRVLGEVAEMQQPLLSRPRQHECTLEVTWPNVRVHFMRVVCVNVLIMSRHVYSQLRLGFCQTTLCCQSSFNYTAHGLREAGVKAQLFLHMHQHTQTICCLSTFVHYFYKHCYYK